MDGLKNRHDKVGRHAAHLNAGSVGNWFLDGLNATLDRLHPRLPHLGRIGASLVVLLGVGVLAGAVWAIPSLFRAPPQDTAVVVPPPKIAPPARPPIQLPHRMPREPSAGVDPVVHTVQVGRGDTLMALLLKTGIDRREAHNAIVALREVYNPRRLRPGQEVVVRISPEGGEGGGPRLMGLRLRTDYDRDVAVGRLVDDRFGSLEIKKQLALRPTRITGAIQTSLSVDADRAGVPPQVLIEFIRLFSFDVDFQRDIQPNDSFEILYERFHDARDRPVHDGEQLYAALTLTGVRLNLYRFESKKGGVEYFNEKGESAQKALMRTPVDGARLSSRFGRRRHPILGFTKLHTGVDFAAPRGTPVMAAGRGVIDYAGRNGAYGKYVRIRHNSTYSTAYGHLKRYARGIKRGQRVRQGQVIGYVGSTGRSTGPHLHYEVLRRGRRINPMKLRLPSGRKLAGKELAQFKRLRDAVDEQRRALPPAAIARKKEE